MSFEVTRSAEVWDAWCAERVDDVYASWRYLEIWADEERAEPLGFR